MSDDGVDDGRPDLVERVLDIETVDGPMAVLSKEPSDGTDRTVVIFHDGPGLRNATHEFSRKLATDGYHVLVPDLYHRHGRMIGFSPAEAAADPTVHDRVREMIASLTDDGIQQDLDAVLTSIEDLPERMACLGFCLGARAVFRTMMRLPDRFVVGAAWHPSYLVDEEPDSPHLLADRLPGPLYLGFGETDTVMPVASMRPFIDAIVQRDAETIIDIHPGAEHAFTWPDSPRYDAAAAEKSWVRTTGLFERVLG